MIKKIISFLVFALILLAPACSGQKPDIHINPLETLTPKVSTQEPLFTVTPGLRNDMAVASTEPSSGVVSTITATPASDFWADLPVVPTSLSERVRQIYQRGLEMGNDPHAFSKVGDCHSTNPYFLADYDLGPDVYNLGDYADLQPTIDYF